MTKVALAGALPIPPRLKWRRRRNNGWRFYRWDRRVFHSFRHSFRGALREARVSQDVADRLMGHADSSMGGRYGRGFSVDVFAEAVNKISYGLDLSHLYTD